MPIKDRIFDVLRLHPPAWLCLPPLQPSPAPALTRSTVPRKATEHTLVGACVVVSKLYAVLYTCCMQVVCVLYACCMRVVCRLYRILDGMWHEGFYGVLYRSTISY